MISAVKKRRKSRVRPEPVSSSETANSRRKFRTPSLSLNFNLSVEFQKKSSFLFFCFLFCFWAIRYRDFLYFVQDYDLFSWNQSFWNEATTKISGVLLYITSFLIQFFYYPSLGGGMLAALFLLMQILTARLFELRGRAYLGSFVPPVFLSILITQTGYYIFDSSFGLFRTALLPGFLVALSVGIVYSRFRSFRSRFLFGSIVSLVLFPAIGFFALLGTVFSLIKETSLTSRIRKSLRLEIGALVVLLVPILWLPFYDSVASYSLLYSLGWVQQSVVKQDSTSYWFFGVWTTLLLSSYLILGLVFLRNSRIASKNAEKRGTAVVPLPNDSKESSSSGDDRTGQADGVRSSATDDDLNGGRSIGGESNGGQSNGEKLFGERLPVQKNWISKFRPFRPDERLTFVVFLLILLAAPLFSFNDPRLFATLKIGRALEEENWRAILNQEAKSSRTYRPLIVARLLSLYRTGEIGDRLFERPLTGSQPIRLDRELDYRIFGDRILYYFGFNNLAARGAMNNYVVCDQRSVWALKTLALTSLVNQESDAARRYFNILSQTKFHAAWANRYLNYLDEFDRRTEELQAKELPPEETRTNEAISFDETSPDVRRDFESVEKELIEARRFLPPEDFLEQELLQNYLIACDFLTQNYSNGSVEQQAMQLAFFLILQYPDDFRRQIDAYIESIKPLPVPKAFLEALIMTAELNKEPFNFSKYPCSPEFVQRFRDYAKLIGEYTKMKDEREKERFKAEIAKEYSDTLWFYVTFVGGCEF